MRFGIHSHSTGNVLGAATVHAVLFWRWWRGVFEKVGWITKRSTWQIIIIIIMLSVQCSVFTVRWWLRVCALKAHLACVHFLFHAQFLRMQQPLTTLSIRCRKKCTFRNIYLPLNLRHSINKVYFPPCLLVCLTLFSQLLQLVMSCCCFSFFKSNSGWFSGVYRRD